MRSQNFIESLPVSSTGHVARLCFEKHLRLFLALLIISFSCLSAEAQSKTVTGKVFSSQDGAPLGGVSVTIKGTSKGTVTDTTGGFSIQAAEGQALILSHLGFGDNEIIVGNRNNLTITLVALDNRLNDVVVVGYGKLRRKDLTGAVSSIKAERIENERPQTVQDILRGNIAGLAVGFSTSAKGDADLEIRGDNSLKTSSSPLIVLDGVIYPGALTDINPNDIESIDVLKDASSTAIFGARAANGIIQITTKKGNTKIGKAQITFNSSVGLATMATVAPVYGAHEFIRWRQDVIRSMNYYNTGVNQKLYIYEDPRNLPSNVTLTQWRDGNNGEPLDVWLSRLGLSTLEANNYKAGKSVDWEDVVYQNGFRQDHNIAISGKRNEFSYYWSLGYNNNEGIIVGDKFKNLRSRINLDAKITDWLSVGLNTQFAKRDESNINAVWQDVYRASPWGSLLKDNGALRLSPTDDLVGSKNPIYDRSFQNRLREYKTLINTLFANVTLPFGISYQLNFSPRFETLRHYNHQSSLHEEWTRFGGGAERQNQHIQSWQIDNLIKWNKTFNDIHKLDVTLLANAEKYESWFDQLSTQGFSPTDALGYSNVAAGSNTANVIGSNDEYSTGDALMARVFYSLKDKYMLTLSMRRDGYSAFGLDNPRANFPAAALGWVFTEENFMKNDFITYGKLRFSWGANGNREIGRYDAYSDMGIGKYPYYTLNGMVYESNQLFVNRMSNPKLKWEKSVAVNVGTDFSIRNGLLDGSIEFYNMRTLDLLIDRKLPDIVGFTSVTANLGEVENKGFELNLNARIMDHSNFKWRTSFNFSLNRNKIIHLYGDKVDVLDASGNVTGRREADDITNRWFIGRAIDEIWDPKLLGVWQLGQEADAAKFGQFPGDFRIKDVDNSGSINQLDHEFQGFQQPRFRWNMRHDFNILKNFTFSFSMYSYWGHKGMYNVARNSDGFPERNNAYVSEYWTPSNPTNDFSRIRSLAGGVNFNVWRDRSFIRLDNISLAYAVPEMLLKKAHISGLKFFGTVRNAGHWAPKWKYWDPEFSGPNPRFFTFGLNMSL
jgi:TonB-dependent starch-binding outer membrane protein SusC